MAEPPDDRRAYLNQLASRLVELLDDDPDAARWKDEFAREAEARGWATSAHHQRRDPNWVLAMDLFQDNPIAFERLSNIGFELPPPADIEDLSTFLDFII